MNGKQLRDSGNLNPCGVNAALIACGVERSGGVAEFSVLNACPERVNVNCSAFYIKDRLVVLGDNAVRIVIDNDHTAAYRHSGIVYDTGIFKLADFLRFTSASVHLEAAALNADKVRFDRGIRVNARFRKLHTYFAAFYRKLVGFYGGG